MDEFRALDVRLQMEQIICEREGMVAENKQREHQGLAMAYDYDAFTSLYSQLERLREIIRQ